MVVVATTLGGAALLPAGSAHAAVIYTWTGAVSNDWGNAQNWSPQHVPGPFDTAEITSSIGTTTVSVSGPVTVGDLKVEETQYNLYLGGTGKLTVIGIFDWTGGDISLPVGVSGWGRIGAGELKALTVGSSSAYHGSITVAGNLLLDDIGTDADRGLDLYPDYAGDNDGIRIGATGTLQAQGSNLVSGTGCCTDPARIVNDGIIDMHSGHTTLRAVEVDQLGTATVAPTARLTQATGPARLGAGAVYRGGGTIEFLESAALRAEPASEPVPGGILMQGTGQLADHTRLRFGAAAKLTGVGGFNGPGTVDFDAAANSAQQAAVIYGDLTIGATATARFAGAVPARLSVWKPGLSGYHGVLRLRGKATMPSGKSFIPEGGTTATVYRGARLNLTSGSTWGGGDCCTQPAKLTVAAGGMLAVPAGSGSAARVVRVDLRTKGTLALGSGKRLATSGYRVSLGGTLRVSGRASVAAPRAVVTGSAVKGRFGCVAPRNQVATYSATRVRLSGTLGGFSGCVKKHLKKKVLSKRLRKHQGVKVKANTGVPKAAKKVLLAVTVTRPARRSTIKVGGVRVKVPAKRTSTRYVVARRSKGKVTVANPSARAVRVRVVLIGVPK